MLACHIPVEYTYITFSLQTLGDSSASALAIITQLLLTPLAWFTNLRPGTIPSSSSALIVTHISLAKRD